MIYDTYTIAAITKIIHDVLCMKTLRGVKGVDFHKKLSTEKIARVRESFMIHDKMRKFTGHIFNDLSNKLNSGMINIETILIFIFDEFVRTDKPMNYNSKKKFDDFKNDIRFNSVLDVGTQMKLLNEMKETIENQPKIAKFSGLSLSLFETDEDQKNTIYELVREGKISYLIYSFLLKNSKFIIDEKKIKDLSFLKFIKIIHYIQDKNIKIENIKYEVN